MRVLGGMAARAALGVCVLLAVLVGCRRDNSYVPPPPPQVGVVHPVARAVLPYLEATGSTVAFNDVDLVARVEGFVQSIDYRDGTFVTAGTRLFLIEPAPYQAKLQQAQASYASAQAQFVQSDAEYRRQSSLGRSDFASQSAVDQARATRDSNQANVTNQQAAVALAGINLGYTSVTAPFDGVVTQHLVSVGDLVGAGAPTRLATIVQLDPIYVTFSISEANVQEIRAGLAKAGLTVADLGTIPVEVGLMTDQGYPYHGVLDYVSPQVDAATGTLMLRAILKNPNSTLLPGYFVRVRVPRSQKPVESLLVPDAALGSSQAGRYVLVVDDANVVEQRSVQVGARDGALRVIESGLKATDRVVVNGLARAIPGEKVAPAVTPMPGS
jgi:multidrug efflux system membrane fusion protein